MIKLEKNWLTKPIIDTEYKQYILLAYLQQIKDSFSELKLYPHFSELIDQYCELVQLKDNKLGLAERFPKTLKSLDFNEMDMVFSKDITEESWVEELSNIIEMAIPFLKDTIGQGKEIYEEIERSIYVEPVGVEPIKNHEGYFILNSEQSTETLVYSYRVSLFESSGDKYRSIHTNYAAGFVKSLRVTNGYIKLEMIKQYPDVTNPSVYAFNTDYSLPVESTYLPIVKRMVTRFARLAG